MWASGGIVVEELIPREEAVFVAKTHRHSTPITVAQRGSALLRETQGTG
jgi:hypothetical protein